VVTAAIISLIIASAVAIWYIARKLSAAEAGQAEAGTANDRVRALERQRAEAAEKRKESDLNEANSAAATRDPGDGWAFLQESWKRPR
jgi:hypothetical protein